MAGQTLNLRNQLRNYQFKVGVMQNIPCSEKENAAYAKLLQENQPLPAGVFPFIYESGEESREVFYTLVEPDLTQEEIKEYLTYKNLIYLRTIKNCLVFFTVLTVIGMIFGFMAALGIFS